VLKRIHIFALLVCCVAGLATLFSSRLEVVSQRSTVIVEGRVQTDGNLPVGGVWVSLIRRTADGLSDADVIATLGGAQMVRVQSAPDGSFKAEVSAGQYDIRAYESGFQSYANGEPVVVDVGASPAVRIQLVPTASLGGVIQADEPVTHGVVIAHPDLDGDLGPKEGRIEAGRFSVVGLEPGDYRVELRAPGLVPVTDLRVTLEDGERLESLEVTLDTGLSIGGTVDDDRGAVGNAEITVVDEQNRQSVQSDKLGRFTVSGLLPGTYDLTVNSREHSRHVVSVRLEDSRDDLEVLLSPLGRIVGQIEGAEQGTVFAVLDDQDLEDVDGTRWVAGEVLSGDRFEIVGLPEGAYHLVFVADGFLRTFFPGTADPDRAAAITVLDGETTEADAFEPMRGSTLTGQMVSQEDDQPVSDAIVEVSSLDRRETLTAVTEDDGRFSLSGVGAGRYLVKVRREGFITQFFPGVTRPEAATALEVDGVRDEGNLSVLLPRRARADFNEDGEVDVADLERFADRLMAGGTSSSVVFDPNGDGLVTYDDFDYTVDLSRASGRVIDPPTILSWKSADAEQGAIRAALRADKLVPSSGYVAKVHYDTEEASFVGAASGESLYKDGRTRVEEIGPGVLLVLSGVLDGDTRSGSGELVSLVFRPKDGKTGVRLRTEALTVLLPENRMAAPAQPDPIRLLLPPETFYLLQNVPNPFNPETTIAYELPEAVQVQLAIFNLVGQRVRGLVDEFKTAGRYEVRWDGKDDFGRDVGSGVYFYSLEAGTFSTTKRMLLIR